MTTLVQKLLKGLGAPKTGRLVPFIILVPAAIGILTLVTFMARINAQIELQRTAISGNLTWEVSQLEVDLLNFQNAVNQAREDGMTIPHDALQRVRRYYDILYSRVAMLKARQYRELLMPGDPYLGGISKDTTYILSLGNMMDGSDAALSASLDAIDARLSEVHAHIRDSVVATLQSLIHAAEDKRLAIQNLLGTFTLITALLILTLVTAAVALIMLTRTARRRALESERISAHLRMTIEASPDAVIVADEGGHVLEFNSAAEAIFGHLRTDALTARVIDLGIARELGDICHRTRSEPAQNGFVVKGAVMTGLRRDGSAFPLETTIAAEHDLNGEKLYICFMRDISPQVEAERGLRDARDAALKSEQAKSRFLGVMSHEMRTPLTGVIAALEMLRDACVQPAHEDFLRIARSCARTALEQVEDLLEITRLDQPTLRETATSFDLVGQIHEIVDQYRPLAEQRGNTLTCDVSGLGDGRFVSFRRSIGRVVMNLLSNATKFTRDGSIRLVATFTPDAAQGGALTISVTDTGIGIPAEMQDRIFENFETGDASYTRPNTGTGLGLGIVRLAVEKMGGTIALDSTPGKGSRFEICIPVSRATPEQAMPTVRPASTAVEHQPAGTGQRQTVLLVEDNGINRTMIRRMIERAGHAVTEAGNGAEAVAAAAGQAFDVIFMDVSMPVMDGLQATREIRAAGGRQRIIGLTAHVLPQQRSECLEAGMDEVEAKPITLARIDALLGGAPAPVAASELLDPTVLSEAREMLGPEMMDKTLRLVFDETQAVLSALDAHKGEAPEDLARAVHRLAGSVGMVGATAAARALSEVEGALLAREGAQPVGPSVARLKDVWQRTHDALQAPIAAQGR
ncbi:MAG: response regulator [Paracoccaceae bacterium]|nr:response regulator [Paracoccaceae bacterium]